MVEETRTAFAKIDIAWIELYSSQLAADTLIHALIRMHPDKAALLKDLQGLMEADTVTNLYQVQSPAATKAQDKALSKIRIAAEVLRGMLPR